MQQTTVTMRRVFRLSLTFVAFLVPAIGTAHAPSPSDDVSEGLSAADLAGTD